MVRNLTAAEPSPDPDLELVTDSATPESGRADLPSSDRIRGYRAAVAERVHIRLADIDESRVGAPNQLRVVGQHLLVTLINHEYQHDQWISEVRHRSLGHGLPPRPVSARLTEIDGYTVLIV
jgi:hypothetical protein